MSHRSGFVTKIRESFYPFNLTIFLYCFEKCSKLLISYVKIFCLKMKVARFARYVVK